MASAKELNAYLNRVARMYVPRTEMVISVRVTDARTRFGSVDLLVTPVTGSGEAWVQLDSVMFGSPEPITPDGLM